ncbi:UNKNOWN [Stylonychia lemnae]|uniref:Uncharacterized protein n=1 Tax=Stylonychia lemnae TaxID=5949 RepID=A0A078AGU5_STYLE|nr:UNKNOWN [Stylonychia lemnae]|eukprot:CDW81066.1 UNKNOWN [Stylonychia lemnae]
MKDASNNNQQQIEINTLKVNESKMQQRILELESDNLRLQNEIKTLIGVNYNNQKDKQIQTDTYSDKNDDPSKNPQLIVKKQREELLQHKRTIIEQKGKIDHLQERIIELEQDIQIRNKALQKLTQGTQMASVIGSVKEKIREDLNHKFKNLQSHIKSLENVIDTNSKLIKDLTESIQEKNIENQSLKNEDKIKQGKIESLTNKTLTLEKQVQEQLKKETQLRIELEKMLVERDKNFIEKQITLPQLQLSTEQVIIAELQEQLIHFKVENLKLEEANRKLENQYKKADLSQKDLQNELEKLQSQIDRPNVHYILKQIQVDPQNLEFTVAKINEALQYIDRNITRHNFKEELLNFYEDKLNQLHDKYEYLLLTHLQQQTHLVMCQSQLNQMKLQSGNDSGKKEEGSEFSNLLHQQWQQTEKHLLRYEQYSKDQLNENKKLKIKLQEIEEQLIQYKKYVVFDQTQYEKLLKLRNQSPLSKDETSIITLFLQNQQATEFQRMSKILDTVVKSNIELEYKLNQNNSERLRNEYHLIIEQREMQIRQSRSMETPNQQIRKLEHLVNEIQIDTQTIELMNRPDNNAQIMLREAFDYLDQISDIINSVMGEQNNSSAFNFTLNANQTLIKDPINQAANKTQNQLPQKQDKIQPQVQNLNKTQEQMNKKKVQTTNLITIEGKKPRFANDYDKKAKQPQARINVNKILGDIMDRQRECFLKLSATQKELVQEQKIRNRQASDSLKEISILKDSLLNRQSENQELINEIKKILVSKNELTNQLIVRDFMITQVIPPQPIQGKTSPKAQKAVQKKDPQVNKLEGLTKINNFLRKKELLAREECDLLKHKLDKMDKERLSLNLDNKKLTEQIRYLQQLIKNQREQFRKFGGISESKDDQSNIGNADIPDDDIVKYLVQIDELNQKNSELEYMLQIALQGSLEKEKLMRGTEDIILSMNTNLEQITHLIQSQLPIAQKPIEKINKLPRLPAFTGPETVYERLNVINKYIGSWYQVVSDQITALQKQKDTLETMKPSNQTITQAEHQAKLEKYLNIYSARIQTLSSIIASYQRHFKTLEDQIRDLQNIPNIQAINHGPTQKQIESSRIESLKRMINLKDILIKHQQNEIELIKKTIIGDKFNENCVYYVSNEEKEAILSMRKFDMQVKVIQDYERQVLLTKEDDVKKGEEHVYLQKVNEKIQNDLINVNEVFQTNFNDNKISQKIKGTADTKVKEANQDYDLEDKHQKQKEYLQKWLNMVQDLLQNQFNSEKCKFYVETLNQELPIILSLMQNQYSSIDNLFEESRSQSYLEKQTLGNYEKSYLNQRIKELEEDHLQLNGKVQKHKDQQNYLRSKNQQLQEQNILLKKFLHSKKAMADDFKHFYKEDLINENQFLRSQILTLTPYNEALALEIATLKQQVLDLNHKLLKQDERHLREQELFQNLEQTLLDTQKKLIEKDSEVIRMIKAQKETLFKGNQDQALDLLINTADTLNKETLRLREQNWQLSQNLKSKRLSLEVKTQKIKESKNILRQYEEKIRELIIDNEKLKVLKVPQQIQDGQFSTLLGVENTSSINKDKLIYEIGKDGANVVIKFLDEIAHYKQSIHELANEMQELKVKNTTLMLLLQDKSEKLQQCENTIKQQKKALGNKDESLEKIEFMYQKLNDDFIAQQQALDVYVELAIPVIGKNQIIAFSRCVDNAKLIALMLNDVQKQRNYYYEASIYYERLAHILGEQLKCKDHELQKIQKQNKLIQTKILHYTLQTKLSQGILSRYDKDFDYISKIVQESNLGIEPQQIVKLNENSPTKGKDQAINESPQPSSSKKGVSSKMDHHKITLIPTQQQEKKTFQYQRSSLQYLLNTQLELNKFKSQFIQYDSKIKVLKTKNMHDLSLISFFEQEHKVIQTQNIKMSNLSTQIQSENSNLMLQNIYLSRLCLYSYRENTLIFKRNDEEDQEQVEKLMSIEIDKLRIENRLLQERNDSLEKSITLLKQENNTQIKGSLPQGQNYGQQKYNHRLELLERELQQQIEWNTQLEKEILSKSAQIEALSKIHNDFSQVSVLQQIPQHVQSTTAAQTQLEKVKMQINNTSTQQHQNDNDSILKNLRQEYVKLEASLTKLHEKIYILENKNTQKDQKIQLLSNKVREMEKQLMQQDDNDNQNQFARVNSSQQNLIDSQKGKDSLFVSGREITMQQDIDEIWKKMSELNSLKNKLYERNDDLRVEIESFKTHFSKYEAQEFKKKVQGQESFQYQLYNELNLLREERDILIWQLNKQASQIQDQQSQLEICKQTAIPELQSHIRKQEENDLNYQKEIQLMKEQFLQNTITQIQGHKDFDSIKTMLQLFEGGRLKRDKIQLVYENARLRRENNAFKKEVDSIKKIKDESIAREFLNKKQIVELKNELVRLRVTYDMGEYQNMVVGKSPSKTHAKKSQTTDDQQPTSDKIKQYVEDLVVVRESLLKIEFKNIELEEQINKKENSIEELSQHVKDLQTQLNMYEKGLVSKQNNNQKNLQQDMSETFITNVNSEQQNDYTDQAELDQFTRQVVDLQQRLMEEQWKSNQLQTKNQELTLKNKELILIQEKYLEEVKEHQQLSATISIMQKQIQDLQKPHQQIEVFQDKSDIVFYDMLKERFLMYLALYIDEIRWKNKQLQQAQEKYRVGQDQMVKLAIQIETFNKERESYKTLIDNLVSQKINQLEQEFVTTAQHEEGLSKLEVHIMNQRKKLIQLKSQLDIIRHESEIKDQNIKAMNEIIRNLERHSLEYNSELTECKDECVKLRGDRERYEQRVAFMWERLDFQQKLHHKVVTNNATLEQVIKVYKDEIGQLKAFLHLNIGAIKNNTGLKGNKLILSSEQNIDTTKSHVIQIEGELVRLKNKDLIQDEKIMKLTNENDDLKQYIRLADMLRKTVGIAEQEREALNSQILKKRAKLRELKQKYLRESKDKEKLKERVDFLEKQIAEIRSGDLQSNAYVKALLTENEDDKYLLQNPRELLNMNNSLKQQVRELEAYNFGLKQQLTEKDGQLQSIQTGNSKNNNSDKRQTRTVTPVRIREMQLKSNGFSTTNMSQRLNNLRQNQPPDLNNEFYYGQNNSVDPLVQLKDDIQEALNERQITENNLGNNNMQSSTFTKLPKIGNSNYVTLQSQYENQQSGKNLTQTSFEKRNMTPLPGRMKATHTSLGYAMDESDKPPKPNLQNKTPIIKNMISLKGSKQMGQGVPRNNKNLGEQSIDGQMQFESYRDVDQNNSNSGIGPQLNPQGAQLNHRNSKSNNFIFKETL